MTWQMRNWYWWTWLSGDHIVEQAVHSIDKGAWAMHDTPCVAAVGVGGLASRKGPEPGNIFDHHAVTYDYPNGVKHFHFTHQANNCYSKVFTHIHGTAGTCQVEAGTITDRSGKVVWKYKGQKKVSPLAAILGLGQVADEAVLLVRQGSDVFAIGPECTHYHGPLADGVVADGTVRCPWHHACFDLRTGEALHAPALSPIACWKNRFRSGCSRAMLSGLIRA